MTRQADSRTSGAVTGDRPERQVPVSWEALEDAFENNAHAVNSYLHLVTGEVIRIVDGAADPATHARVVGDAHYLRVDPVSSREQYRWMEHFISTVQESDFQRNLQRSIDGKGAFRRFKDVLSGSPVDRERWFTFRSERLRACIETWLSAHGITPVERPQWRVPTADQVQKPGGREHLAGSEDAGKRDDQREHLHRLVDQVPARDLATAQAFLEFLRDRAHALRRSFTVADAAGAVGDAKAPAPGSE